MAGDIHQSVLDAWVKFSIPIEGSTHNAYLDVKGNLTVGIGCLIDPPERYSGLGWVMPDGSPASESEVLRQLNALKARPGLKSFAYNSQAVLSATSIRLTDDGILKLCDKRLLQALPYMMKAFQNFPKWPADAQLVAFSICWSVGDAWPGIFTNCARLLNHTPPDFILAIEHQPDTGHPGHYLPAAVDISTTGNAGVVPRNLANELCLSNAAQVIQFGLPLEKLYWPSSPVFSDADPRQMT